MKAFRNRFALIALAFLMAGFFILLSNTVAKADDVITFTGSWSELDSDLQDDSYNNKTIRLDCDVTAGVGDSCLTVKGIKTLDLNGHIIDRNLSEQFNDGEVIKVDQRANFTLIDSTPDRTHSPEVSYGKYPYSMESEEPITVIGGVITGGCNDRSGGGVCVCQDATFTMNGGSIVSCRGRDSAGGVYVGLNATFIMNGGTIAGVVSDHDGGGVQNYGGTFIMVDGIIASCFSNQNGGGVDNCIGTFIMIGGTICFCKADGQGEESRILKIVIFTN